MTNIVICDRCTKPIKGDQRGPLRAEITRLDRNGVMVKAWDLHVDCYDAVNIFLAQERQRLGKEG